MHNWDDFRYFHAVAQTGSLSKASKQLGVNHSTVSRRIQALESRHGVRLFMRTQEGYELTDAGTSILDIVEQLHLQSLHASRVLLGQDARLEGKINLTMPHELFEQCLAPALAEFSQLHPSIEINLMVSKGLKDLANQEADLAIRFSPAPPDYLVGKQICRIQHGIYQNQNLNTQNETPIVVWGFEDGIPSWASERFDNPHIALKVDSLSSMFCAVKEGLGIARMPCFMPDIIAHPEVNRLPHTLPLSDWGVWLLHHIDLKNTARIRCLKSFLENKLNRLTPLFLGNHTAQV